MLQSETPDEFPEAQPPDIWIVYRTNPAISFWDTGKIVDTIAKFPFTICFAYTPDETNHMADVLLPDCTDLEAQLIRMAAPVRGTVLGSPRFCIAPATVEATGEAKDFTWIAPSLPSRRAFWLNITTLSTRAQLACACRRTLMILPCTRK